MSEGAAGAGLAASAGSGAGAGSASGSSTSIVSSRIRADIIGGVLPPGSKLRETSLAKQYEVSRIPVREALRSLEAEGLVESRPYTGSVVAPSPIDDAEDLFEIRIVLETATARRAAERAAAQSALGAPDPRWWQVRKQVNEILTVGETAIAESRFKDLAELNMQFHFAIAELSGSQSLVSLLRQISGKIEWLYSLNVTRRGSSAWPEHREIIAAVDAGQATAASEAMARHVSRSRDSYFAMMAEQQS